MKSKKGAKFYDCWLLMNLVLTWVGGQAALLLGVFQRLVKEFHQFFSKRDKYLQNTFISLLLRGCFEIVSLLN